MKVLSAIALCLSLILPSSAFATAPNGVPHKVLDVLQNIEKSIRESRYQHYTVVRPQRGQYFFDCSGMAAWVLRRSAPNALRVVGRPGGRRPLAKNFHRAIARIPLGKTRGPWYRVPNIKNTQPGDIIAWVRPPWFPSKNTGHVAFVVSQPQPNPGGVMGYLIRIADASRYRHQYDSRNRHETGYGTGVILIATDQFDQSLGYGWHGGVSQPDWIVHTKIAIGRPLR